MYYDIMTSQITKLVLVPLEEWKRLNKNGGGGGDTYTTIEIPLSKPRNQEGRGKNQEQKEELNPLLLLFLIIPLSGTMRN